MEQISESDFCSSLYGELQSEGTCGWYVAVSHEALERGIGQLPDDARILEVGGNLGEHCPYVKHPYAEYVVTDYRETEFVALNERIRFEVANAEELLYPDNSYDRALVTCLLHHLPNPEQALHELRRVVKPGGVVSITLPCDPGVLYRFGKAVGPYRSIKQRGISVDPRYFHYHQHRNHYPGLVPIIDKVFGPDFVRKRSWPLRLPTWNFNLFTIYQIRITG